METRGSNLQRKGQGSSESREPREQQRIQRTSGNFSPSLWSGHPLDTMMRLSRDMDQLVGSFFGDRFGYPRFNRDQASMGAATELWQPRIDLCQRDDNLLISAELPGVTRDAVRIETTEDGIAISGERREAREEGARGGDYHLSERSFGSFYRAIPLPEGAQAELAKATMRDGVLEITIPCKQTTQRRQIQISD
jgi:HSP20 family protein